MYLLSAVDSAAVALVFVAVVPAAVELSTVVADSALPPEIPAAPAYMDYCSKTLPSMPVVVVELGPVVAVVVVETVDSLAAAAESLAGSESSVVVVSAPTGFETGVVVVAVESAGILVSADVT